MRIWVWLASWACRLRHPCPITESCRHAGQMRTISPGLPSASFHAINTITAVAKASSGSPLERCPVGRLRYLLNHKSIWKKSLTLPRHPSAFRYWPVNESQVLHVFFSLIAKGLRPSPAGQPQSVCYNDNNSRKGARAVANVTGVACYRELLPARHRGLSVRVWFLVLPGP